MKEQPSKLDAFAERLDEWFGLEKKTLAEVQAQLKLDGCVVSLSRLSEWWGKRLDKRLNQNLLLQITNGSRQCQEVETQFGSNPPPELDTLIKLHRVLIMRLSAAAVADPELLSLVTGMMKPMIAYAKVQESVAARQLDEKKFQFDAVKAVRAQMAELNAIENRSDLDDDSKLEQIRLRLFGSKPATKP